MVQVRGHAPDYVIRHEGGALAESFLHVMRVNPLLRVDKAQISAYLPPMAARKTQNPATVRPKVAKLLSQGHTPREIATQLDITTQRVYQHMAALKKQAERREATA
jgi:hypothetical protein